MNAKPTKKPEATRLTWRKLCSMLASNDGDTFVGVHCVVHKGWPFRLATGGGLEYFDSRQNAWLRY